jgi:unspecific monooxygenase
MAATDSMDTTAIPHPPWRVPSLGDVVGAGRRTPVQDTMKQARGLRPIFTRRFPQRERGSR